tara:strand:+ start:1291 stop:1845 length:555 start_codon:yes stop_codon:yes gene_type:complete
VSDIAFPLHHSVDAVLPAGKPRELTIAPGQEDLARIAEAYGLLGLRDLVADLTLYPFRRDGVRVAGHLTAIATQACVVTLAPVEQPIDETFEVRFDPSARRMNEGDEIEIDALGEDPPEPLEGGRIDLGAVICEQFALALDPFPKAPDAEVPEAYRPPEEGDEDPDDKPPSPFAKLAQLRKDKD